MREHCINHGRNFSKLHEPVDPAILPPFLGGTGPSIEGEVAIRWRKTVQSCKM